MFFNPLFLQVINQNQPGSIPKLNGSSYLFSDIIKVYIDKTDNGQQELFDKSVQCNKSDISGVSDLQLKAFADISENSLQNLVQKLFGNMMGIQSSQGTKQAFSSPETKQTFSFENLSANNSSPVQLNKQDIEQLIEDLVDNKEFTGKISLLLNSDEQVNSNSGNPVEKELSSEEVLKMLKGGATLLVEDSSSAKENGLLITIVEPLEESGKENVDDADSNTNGNNRIVDKNINSVINEEYGLKLSLIDISNNSQLNQLIKSFEEDNILLAETGNNVTSPELFINNKAELSNETLQPESNHKIKIYYLNPENQNTDIAQRIGELNNSYVSNSNSSVTKSDLDLLNSFSGNNDKKVVSKIYSSAEHTAEIPADNLELFSEITPEGNNKNTVRTDITSTNKTQNIDNAKLKSEAEITVPKVNSTGSAANTNPKTITEPAIIPDNGEKAVENNKPVSKKIEQENIITEKKVSAEVNTNKSELKNVTSTQMKLETEPLLKASRQNVSKAEENISVTRDSKDDKSSAQLNIQTIRPLKIKNIISQARQEIFPQPEEPVIKENQEKTIQNKFVGKEKVNPESMNDIKTTPKTFTEEIGKVFNTNTWKKDAPEQEKQNILTQEKQNLLTKEKFSSIDQKTNSAPEIKKPNESSLDENLNKKNPANNESKEVGIKEVNKNIINNEKVIEVVKDTHQTNQIGQKTQTSQKMPGSADSEIKLSNQSTTNNNIQENDSDSDNKLKSDLSGNSESKNIQEDSGTGKTSNGKSFAETLIKSESEVSAKGKIVSESENGNSYKTIKETEIVKEIAKFIQQGNKNSLTVKIDPENLGMMKIKLDVVDNVMKAQIEVENDNAKKMVETNLNQLYNTLNQSGIHLNSINISLNNFDQKNAKAFSAGKKKEQEIESKSVDENSNIQEKRLGYNTYEYTI